ncbi:MAG: hypothetical protein ABEJ35_06925 [Halobacteriaceae archaeon]
MYGLREALAAVLGVIVGLFFIAYPGVVLRVQTAGTRPDRQPGPGGDPITEGGPWLWLIRAVGILLLVGGAYFAVRPLV